MQFEPFVLHDYLPYDSLEVGKDLIEVAVSRIDVFNVGVGVLDEQTFESIDVLQESKLGRPI